MVTSGGPTAQLVKSGSNLAGNCIGVSAKTFVRS